MVNHNFTDDELLELLKQRCSLAELQKQLNTTEYPIRKRMKNLGVSTKDFRMDITVFDTIDTEEKAYWLGFWYADGSVNSSGVTEISLKQADIKHLEKFCDFIKCDYSKIKTRLSKCGDKTFPSCRWATKRAELTNALIEKGCFPNKSLSLLFPEMSIFTSPTLVYDFIRGYVDGDGCLGILTHKTKASTLTLQVVGTREFLEKMCEHLSVHSPIMHKNKRRPESNTYNISLSSDTALRVANLLYGNATIYLDRKYNIYKFAVSQSNL